MQKQTKAQLRHCLQEVVVRPPQRIRYLPCNRPARPETGDSCTNRPDAITLSSDLTLSLPTKKNNSSLTGAQVVAARSLSERPCAGLRALADPRSSGDGPTESWQRERTIHYARRRDAGEFQ